MLLCTCSIWVRVLYSRSGSPEFECHPLRYQASPWTNSTCVSVLCLCHQAVYNLVLVRELQLLRHISSINGCFFCITCTGNDVSVRSENCRTNPVSPHEVSRALWARARHGLDLSMDWIGLNSMGWMLLRILTLVIIVAQLILFFSNYNLWT